MEITLKDIDTLAPLSKEPSCSVDSADDLTNTIHAMAPQTIQESLAWVALRAGLAKEAAGTNKLHALTGDVKMRLKQTDALLDLHAELIALPEKDSHDISDKVQGMMKDLKAHGIDVWPNGGNKISKDKLNEVKSHISSQIDKLQAASRTTMTTEIQPEIHAIQTIMSMTQQMIQSDARLKKHISDNSTK